MKLWMKSLVLLLTAGLFAAVGRAETLYHNKLTGDVLIPKGTYGDLTLDKDVLATEFDTETNLLASSDSDGEISGTELFKTKSNTTDNYANDGIILHNTYVRSHTMMMWIKVGELPESEDKVLWKVYNSSNWGYAVKVTSEGKLKVGRIGGDDFCVTSDAIWTTDTVANWCHIAVSLLRTTTGGNKLTPTLYINGIQTTATFEATTCASNLNGDGASNFMLGEGVSAAGVVCDVDKTTTQAVMTLDDIKKVAVSPASVTYEFGALLEGVQQYYSFDTDNNVAYGVGTAVPLNGSWTVADNNPFGEAFGKALTQNAQFDISSDENTAFVPGTGDFTVALWYQSTLPSSDQRIISRGAYQDNSNSSPGWSLWLTSEGKLQLKYGTSAGAASRTVIETDNAVLTDSTPAHIAWTRSGTAATIYVDGIAVKSDTLPESADIAVTGSTWFRELRIGNGDASNVLRSEEYLDELTFWNRALTENEVASLKTMSVLANITSSTRTLSESTEAWTDAKWGTDANGAAPVVADKLTLTSTCEGGTTLTMDTSALAEDLVLEGSTLLTLANTSSNKLQASVTAVNTDTTVNAGVASLGAVTIADGKTLTVKDTDAIDSIVGGSLVVDASESALAINDTSLLSRDDIRKYAEDVVLKGSDTNGVTLTFADGSETLQSYLTFEGGSHVLKYGAGTKHRLFGPQGGDSHPAITVKSGTSLTFATHDLSGWQSMTGSENVVVLIEEDANLIFTPYNEANADSTSNSQTSFFNNRLVLKNNATVDVAVAGHNWNPCFRMNGGVRSESTAQIAMLDSDTSVAAKVEGQTIFLATDSTAGLGISAGQNTSLTIENVIAGAQAVTKYGAGTLTLSGANTATGTLTVDAGALVLSNAWDGPVTLAANTSIGGAATITGTLTLGEGSTIDATAETQLTANTLATLPAALTVKVSAAPKNENPVTILNTTTTFETIETVVTVLDADGNEIEGDYFLSTTGTVLQLEREPYVENAVLNTQQNDGTNVTSWSALVGNENMGKDYINANLTIHFSEANQTFTFDNTETVSFASVTVTGEAGTIALGENAGSVTATATAINADTTVNAGVMTLGAVTIADDKTLTVKDTTSFTSIAGGALTIDAGTQTFTEAFRNTIRDYDGVVTLQGATTMEFPHDSGSALTARLKYASGEHTLQYGRSYGNGTQLFATGRGDDNPTISIQNSATLNFRLKDLSGWSGSVSDTPAVIRVENGGNLKLQSSGGTGFFRDRLILDNGATVTNEDNNFILHGGASTNAAKAQIAMLDSETESSATFAGVLALHNYSGGQAGQRAASISVGENATLKFTGEVKGDGSDTLRKLGAGTMILQNMTSAPVLAIDEGVVKFTASLTSTNAVSGAGSIVADGEGVVLNLAGATMNDYTGTPVVMNGATLILPAGAENGMEVPEGCTVKLVLSEQQQVAGYTADVAEGSSVTLHAAADLDNPIVDGEEDNDQNTFTPALNTWTNASNDGAWATADNWSKGELPSDTDAVAIQISGDTTLTLAADTTIGAVVVKGTGTLTIAGAKLTATSITAKTNISSSDAYLALVPMQIAEGVTVTYEQSGDDSSETNIPEMTGEGIFAKTGPGRLTFDAAKVCEPQVEWGAGILRFGAAHYNNTYHITAKDGSTILMGAGWTGELTSSASTLKLEGGSTLWLYNGNNAQGSTVAAQIVIDSTAEKPAVIAGSQCGSNTNITGSISGNGVVEFQDKNDNYFTVSGSIKDGDQEGDQLKVVVKHDRDSLTFTGANTYTGGTEIAEGAKLKITDASALGTTGAITGAGTLVCTGVVPTNKTGLNAAAWSGTVQLDGDISDSTLDVAILVNANSSLTINGELTVKTAACSVKTLALNGSLSITSDSDTTRRMVVAELTGAGTLYGQQAGETLGKLEFVFTSADTFTGTIDLSGATSEMTSVCFGQPAAKHGYIVFTTDADAIVPANQTWTAVNGVYVHAAGAIMGNGTIALGDGAEFRYESSETSTFAGAITGVTTDGTTTYGDLNVNITSKTGCLILNGTVDVATATLYRKERLTYEDNETPSNAFEVGGTLTIHEKLTYSGDLYASIVAMSQGVVVIEANATVVNDLSEGQMRLKLDLRTGAILDIAAGNFIHTLGDVVMPTEGAVIVKVTANSAIIAADSFESERTDALTDRFTIQYVDSEGNVTEDTLESMNGYIVEVTNYGSTCYAIQTVSADFPDDVAQELATLVFGSTYGHQMAGEFTEIKGVSNPNVVECFTGYGMDIEAFTNASDGIVPVTYAFGVGDIRIFSSTVTDAETQETTTTQYVVVAVKVENGYEWPAYLRKGTKIQLSTDDAAYADVTALTADELVACGLAADDTEAAEVLAGKDGVYWYWAGAIPELDAGALSKTMKYEVKAVNGETASEE